MSTIERAPTGLEIAVVGMAARFPGAPDTRAFWDGIASGTEFIRFYDREELRAFGVDPALCDDPALVPAHASLDGLDLFDAAFFGLTPREAELMDPQHRLFLEVSWEALENAGHEPSSFPGPIAVVAGSSANEYLEANVLRSSAGRAQGSFQANVGNGTDFLATRVSYKLDLHGPALTVQTACSTSLVAIHLACQQLLAGACDMALAGGSSASLPSRRGYRHVEGMIFSPDGHCRPFDAAGAGTLKGDGVGVVVLRRLEDALRDRDTIRAVILGSAINNDGARKAGYTAPSVDGQAEVIRAAQLMADVTPDSIGYVEAHGTATPLGDPIEIAALSKAFAEGTDRRAFAAIGSVKSNLGHLDAAAGVAGFVKTVLALENGVLPPSLHFRRPNPAIDFAASPVYVNTEARPWKRDAGRPRRAAVSSFGIGGTNAHVVLEEAPPAPERSRASSRPSLLVQSARTEAALAQSRDRLLTHLRDHPAIELADAAFTLRHGRRAFAHRAVAACRERDQLVPALEGSRQRPWVNGLAPERPRRIVFLFPGQGAQYTGMARGLYDSEAPFRAAIDECAALFDPELGFDLREALFGEGGEAASIRLSHTAVAQPAIFAVEVALARTWAALGVKPDAVLGHSIGEYAAAVVAGVFTLQEAATLVAARGRLMGTLPGGRMAAVGLPRARVEGLLDPDVAIAAINAPGQCVLSGPDEALAATLGRIHGATGLEGHALATSHAFHSAMMDPAVRPFVALVAKLRPRPPGVAFLSTVLGTTAKSELGDPAYWGRNLRDPVRFADAFAASRALFDAVYLECGPGNTLTSLARRQEGPAAPAVASMRRGDETGSDDATVLVEALGRLWVHGAAVRLDALDEGQEQRVALPGYAFERRRFWLEPDALEPGLPTGRQPLSGWFHVPGWRTLPPPTPAAARGSPRSWVVLAPPGHWAQALAARLAQRGEAVVLAVEGTEAHRGDGPTSFRRASATDLAGILSATAGATGTPTGIHVVDARGAPPSRPGRGDDRARSGLALSDLASLAGALEASGLGDRASITLLVAGMADVTGEDPIEPSAAALIPAPAVLPRELPGLRCRVVDVGAECAESSPVDAVLAELDDAAWRPRVALRRGRRWERTFDVVPPGPEGLLWRKGGTYLVTGGLGRLGLAVAEHLLRAWNANVVLLGRRPFPEREQWEAIAAGGQAGDGVRDTVRRLLAACRDGGDVTVVSADVADATQVAEAVRLVVQRHGCLDGVIHAAGSIDADTLQPLASIPAAAIDAQLAPKLDGALALERALEDRPGTFVLLVSSTASVLGGLGYGAYAAANAAMEAQAARARRRGLPWTAVALDALDLRSDPARGPAGGVAAHAVRADEIGPLFDALATLPPQPLVLVSTTPLAGRDAMPGAARERGRAGAPAPDATGTPAATDADVADSAGIAPRDERERLIASVWEDLLGIRPIGVDRNFFELGGDSVIGIQVIARLKQAGLVLSPRDLFEQPTVEALAAVAGGGATPAATAAAPAAPGLGDQDLAQLARLLGGR